MSLADFLSLFGLAMVAGWTPGPNNTLVATAGAQFGFKRTFPMVAGIGIGFPFMVFLVGFGLGALFQTSPWLRETLRIVGICVLLWLAWKIATSGGTPTETGRAKPLGFAKMLAFQWINPKGWVMAISITAQFIDPARILFTALIVAATFVFVGFSSASAWALFGATMQRWLTSDFRRKAFNLTMAALLVLSVIGIAMSDLAK